MIGEMAAGAGDTEAQPRSSLCSVRRHNNTIDQTGPLPLVGIAEILLSLVQSFRVLKYFHGVADASFFMLVASKAPYGEGLLLLMEIFH